MRLFWKIILLVALPIGGYWLCKKWERPTEMQEQPKATEEDHTTSQSPSGKGAKSKQAGPGSTAQLIERLTNIDGVTSRVAENLVAMGIKSKEALMKLTEEELRSVKGIGPKRATKILELE
jgi:ERCC4-type nuclease